MLFVLYGGKDLIYNGGDNGYLNSLREGMLNSWSSENGWY